MSAAKQQRRVRLPFPDARWAGAFLPFPALSISPPHLRRDQGGERPAEPLRASSLPPVSRALCCGQDNLANELFKGPLVTLLASPRPIWEIPLKGWIGSSAPPPSVAARGAHPVTLGPLH